MSSLEKYGEYCREQGIEKSIDTIIDNYKNNAISKDFVIDFIKQMLDCSKEEAESILLEKLNLVQA